jgi:hypothetical protein
LAPGETTSTTLHIQLEESASPNALTHTATLLDDQNNVLNSDTSLIRTGTGSIRSIRTIIK